MLYETIQLPLIPETHADLWILSEALIGHLDPAFQSRGLGLQAQLRSEGFDPRTLMRRGSSTYQLGDYIRVRRGALGQTQTDAARKAGASAGSFQLWESGKGFPQPSNVIKLAKWLDVEPIFVESLRDLG